MPMPNILPQLDWRTIFEGAKDYAAWKKAGQHPANQEAMDRIYAELDLGPAAGWLGSLSRMVHVLAIAEDWCPDVVRHVPVLQKMADASPSIEVRYISRTDHPDVLARFLTNGGESVPKFAFFNADFVQCASWGPMPEDCRDLIRRGRACGDLKTARQQVAALYSADPRKRVVVRELLERIDIASCSSM